MDALRVYISMIILLLGAACFTVSCDSLEDSQMMRYIESDTDNLFYASIEAFPNDPAKTKVFTDLDLRILWNYDDRISIFNKNTYNQQYQFMGKTGANSGIFSKVSADTNVGTGETIDHIYALFPYDINTSVDNQGVVSVNFPQEQIRSDDGRMDANLMISVTDNNRLLFRNVGGYLSVKLYGAGVLVKRITLKGNNNETLTGPASLTVSDEGIPNLTLSSSTISGKSITLTCETPVLLNSTESGSCEFWMVVPPMTFTNGFTITVEDSYGGIFEQSTSNELTITRNHLSSMAPVRVIPRNEEITSALMDLYTDIGRPAKMYSTPDDWEFLTILFCNDLEGADAVTPDEGYNWFNICGDLSSRNANYRNPNIRYRAPQNMIASVNRILAGVNENETGETTIQQLAQARALRAWCYLLQAPAFQFNYQIAGDQPCLPLITEGTPDLSNNPRASVADIYNQIINDLDYAVAKLESTSRSSKMFIDGSVAHGLRARAYLDMGEWQKAFDDAVKAAEGYTPASREEVSVPAFYDINDHNWIWGYDMTTDLAMTYRYATTSSWLRSFSAWGYAASSQVYTCINKLLYDKIPATDIRKQWWVDENLTSSLLDGLKWPGFDDVANADDGGSTKRKYLPYTNVKFGCFTVGTTSNDEDMVLMRVEEMILIQAECKARMGDIAGATSILENFVRTYRDPSYSVAAGGRSLIDEIWFQRRVELWGEGFNVPDTRRLNKPLVRFHDDSGNIAARFRFNLPADDPWLLMRFPQGELNSNVGLVDNTGGQQPVTDQNPELRDGVTD